MVEVDQKPLVTITGISGFLGSHTTLVFLKDGGYRVRGTVRDKNNEAKIAPLRAAFGDLFNQIELVEADLMDKDSLTRAVAGSTFVVHIASPVALSFESEEESVTPAVNGTKAVVEACHANGVRRCVITSSILACQTFSVADRPANLTFNETHWSNPDKPEPMGLLFKSKVLAEKAAWEYQASLPESERFEIVTILPGWINGPPLRTEDFASGMFVKTLLTGAMEKIDDDGIG